MDMQDKEFDRLFNSKLENFEIEPSPMVWENIASELPGKKTKRRSIVPYLSIAASIIVLASVGLLFFNQNEEVVKPVKRSKVVVKINKDDASDKTTKSTVVTTPEITKAPPNEVATVSKPPVFIVPKEVVDEPVNQITTKTNEQVITESITTNQPALAITSPVQKQSVLVVPDKKTLFAVATDNKQQVTETTMEITSTEIIKTSVKKRGIHSLGGLIGALVAKVDKREDKLIEFTESDENGSTITGLNLGLVKIKKK